MTVTLKHVADHVGVSYQTVWRAIHDLPGILPETRTGILEAVAALGYRRNRIAGSLRTRQSASIGLVVLDVRDPHAGEVTIGVEEEAAKRGLSVLLANTGGDPERERAAITSLLERQVDGIILSPSGAADHTYLGTAIPKAFPLVAINRSLQGVRCHAVLSQDADASRAARYMVAQGHRRIAGLFGDLSTTPLRGRHDAFVDELGRHGIRLRPSWAIADANTADAGRRAVHQLFQGARRPAALFAASSRLTEGALYGLRDLGLRHGRDVALVGFDLRYATLLDPPLPVMSQPGREMGRVAVDIVLRLLGKKSVKRLHCLPVQGLE